MQKAIEYAHSKGYKSIELDGIRMEFEHGWALIRFSNTGPNLTIRYEGDSEESLKKIQDELDTLVNSWLKEVKE